MERIIQTIIGKLKTLSYKSSIRIFEDGIVGLDVVNENDTNIVYTITLDLSYGNMNISGGLSKDDVYYFFQNGQDLETQLYGYIDDYFTTRKNN